MKSHQSRFSSVLVLPLLLVLFISIPSQGQINSSLLDMADKLDQFDQQDAQSLIDAANTCTRKRNYSCAQTNINKAKKYVNTPGMKSKVTQASQYLLAEEEREHQEILAKEEADRQEQIRLANIEQENQRRAQEQANASNNDSLANLAAIGLQALAASRSIPLPSLPSSNYSYNRPVQPIPVQQPIQQANQQSQFQQIQSQPPAPAPRQIGMQSQSLQVQTQTQNQTLVQSKPPQQAQQFAQNPPTQLPIQAQVTVQPKSSQPTPQILSQSQQLPTLQQQLAQAQSQFNQITPVITQKSGNSYIYTMAKPNDTTAQSSPSANNSANITFTSAPSNSNTSTSQISRTTSNTGSSQPQYGNGSTSSTMIVAQPENDQKFTCTLTRYEVTPLNMLTADQACAIASSHAAQTIKDYIAELGVTGKPMYTYVSTDACLVTGKRGQWDEAVVKFHFTYQQPYACDLPVDTVTK